MNKIQKAFCDVTASKALKERALQKCAKNKPAGFLPRTIAACLAIITALSITRIFHASITEAAYISIDINPSIGLTLNQFKRVISFDTYNEEAEMIISGLDLKGKRYIDAIDCILNTEALYGYDTAAAEIYIEGSSDSLNNEINDTILKRCPHVNTSCHNAENKLKAAAYNISPGKYYVIEQIIPYGGTIDDYKDKSMKELKEIYSHCSGEGVSNNSSNGSGHHSTNGRHEKQRHK